MHNIIDLARYPLDRPGSDDWATLIGRCRDQLDQQGLFNLDGFLLDAARDAIVSEISPLIETASFHHEREHNIYFRPTIPGLADDHPVLTRFQTSNRTICADQMADGALIELYERPEFAAFLAAVMGKPALYPMQDPLARVNVMAYAEGQALNWHFDRSEFTTTLLLQAPLGGGAFEYARDLRSDDAPNYDGVAGLIRGELTPTTMALSPGTLNVFRGRNTAHRVTPVAGERDRIIAVFSYFDRPDVRFSDKERIGFYGRAS